MKDVNEEPEIHIIDDDSLSDKSSVQQDNIFEKADEVLHDLEKDEDLDQVVMDD
jgi:hypothetical protein